VFWIATTKLAKTDKKLFLRISISTHVVPVDRRVQELPVRDHLLSVDPQAEHMLPRRTSRPATLPCHLPVLLENVPLLGRADREGDAKTEPGVCAQATAGAEIRRGLVDRGFNRGGNPLTRPGNRALAEA